MADNEKYFYLKLKENFFDSESMVLLESMDDGYLYSNILLKLYLRSLKGNEKLMFNDRIPYDSQMIANVTRHDVSTVEKAIEIFKRYGLIEILDSGAIFMTDIQNFIGKSSTEAERKREYRARIESEKGSKDNVRTNVQTKKGQSPPEIELKTETETKTKKEKIDYQKIVNLFNGTCVSFSHVQKLSETRKKAIRARFATGYTIEDFERLFQMAEQSDFLKGANKDDWQAPFDWLISDKGMSRTLSGNYANRNANQKKQNEEERTKDGSNAEEFEPLKLFEDD